MASPNSARSRSARRITGVAAPAVCGVAAAFALAGSTAASASASTLPGGQGHVHLSANRTTVKKYVAKHAKPATVSAKLTSATSKAASAQSYSVQSGDTLSSIAEHFYKDPAYWPAIYWANQSDIKYANDISAGQNFKIPAKPSSVPSAPSTLSAPAPVQQPTTSASTDSEESTPVRSAPTESTSSYSTDASTSGDSAFQQCVISHESGGDSQVMNSSGHYGLYQFSASTWAAYGGNPSDFGNASASEQNQVFDNAVAQGGQSNWSAYDGC